MGAWLGWFFGEKDEVLVKEIAKAHNIPKDKTAVVKKHYEKMLEEIKNELSEENKD